MVNQRRLVWLIGFAIVVLTLSGVGNSTVFSRDPLQRIESDDARVQASGSWTPQSAGGASGGSYLYSSGSPDDVLTIAFAGTTASVLYVAGPQLGILAVEVDGTVLRTIITAADTPQFQQQANFSYLSDGIHTLRLYASSGIIAIDAVVVSPSSGDDSSALAPVSEPTVPAKRSYDTLAALGEVNALTGPAVALYATFAENPAASELLRQPVNYLVNVMGDWDGDGQDTYGTVYNGVFDYTNVTPDQFSNLAEQSQRALLGVEGAPVVGRFNRAFANDCIGVVSPLPANAAAFVLYYVCDYATNLVRQQYLGEPLRDDAGFSGPYHFAAGDFDADGLDSLAVMRATTITYTNVDPSLGEAAFTYTQAWGEPAHEGGPRTLVTGDWDGDGVDSFGVVYGLSETAPTAYFYRRNDLRSELGQWALQRIPGTSRVAVWR